MTLPTILLPWPPSSLSGHNTGHWRAKADVVRKHREWARNAVMAANVHVDGEGDIQIKVRFVPPDNRGDRTNFPNRIKPVFDGIADALKVNDRRFLPSFEFAPAEKPGCLEIVIGGPS